MADRYASLKQGLVGCWIPSVSGSGLLLPDLSSRGNNGSLVNMDASDWVSGQYGRALDFDGTDDVVSLGVMPPALRNLPLRDFSISFFCNPRSQGENSLGTIIDTYDTGAAGWYVLLRGVSGASYAIQSGVKFLSTDLTHISGSDFFAVNRFDHVAIVFRNATKDLLLYRNGLAINFPQTSTPSGTYNDDSSQAFRIGNRNAGDRTWDGNLDDLRLYSRVLTEPEIKLLASEPGIGFKPAKKLSRFSQRFTYKPAKPRNYSVIRNRDPNYSTLRQGLVAAYCPSISGQGNVLPDLVGGNHGTLTNMTADDWVASGDGRALDFDGSNDYVSCGTSNNSLLVQSKAFSISAWIYLTSTTSDRTILTNAKITPNYDGMNFLSAAGKLRFDLGGDASPTFPLKRKETTSAVFSTGIWYHVAVTKPASASTSAISLYVNGAQPATTDAFNDTVADAVNNVNLQIAARDGANSLLQGQIDDLRLYSRALTEPEIKLLASKRGIGLEPRKPKITFADLGVQKTYSVVRVKETDYGTLRQGLVGAWCPSLPNGGSGNTLPDVSGYGNHGTLTNMSPDDWVSGQYGRALDFDGSNDYVTIAKAMPRGDRTISAWFYRTTTTGRRGIFATRDTPGTGGYVLTTSLSGTASLTYYHTTGTTLTTASNVWAANEWNHVSVTLAGLSVNFFINGRSVGSGTMSALENATSACWIATEDGNTAEAFFGQLDDVRLYSRALSEPEIRLLASRPGIGLRQDRDRNMFYQFPSGSRRRRILTGMP